jgi:hypothetical protein
MASLTMKEQILSHPGLGLSFRAIHGSSMARQLQKPLPTYLAPLINLLRTLPKKSILVTKLGKYYSTCTA